MHGHHHISHAEDSGPLKISSGLRFALLGLGVIGLIVFFLGAFTGEEVSRQNAWTGFLVSYVFFLFLSMGAGAFLALQYIAGAKWFVVVKRIPESVASFAFRGGILFPIIGLLGTHYLYAWDPTNLKYAHYPAPGTLKAIWLSPSVHAIKVCVYMLPLAGLMYLIVSNSTKSDSKRDPGFKLKQLRLSIFYMVFFAFLFSLFGWDVLMSLSPKWFSTMFGVYCFSGAFVSSIALMMLMLFWIRGTAQYMQTRHMYDMGTYVMAFATFMMYIGFSQFMLIWYANLPEETFFYMDRYVGGWWYASVALPVLKWMIPFLILMPSTHRTKLVPQTIACVSVLLGQVLDIYWIVIPNFSDVFVLPSLLNIATFIGVFGFFGYSTLSFLARHSIVPTGDPNLLASINGDYLHA